MLIDLLKHQYEAAFDAIRETIAPGGIVIADNVMIVGNVYFGALLQSVESEEVAESNMNTKTRGIADYLARVRADSAFEIALVPLGTGIAVSCRTE